MHQPLFQQFYQYKIISLTIGMATTYAGQRTYLVASSPRSSILWPVVSAQTIPIPTNTTAVVVVDVVRAAESNGTEPDRTDWN
ncbi:uncharacterized protein LOC143211780 isoform X2 [Lasioglossum baleicum]|uniref:uncharacterized protein LOC143211780 isoform X2 n=1 Tax=Lasioglossum baleicum TaxID=434251 RepID=UPI003FCD715E